MSLLSKRTFRKWAKVLTERGLTVDDADLVAEVGNTVYVKGKPPLDDTSPITVEDNFVTFTVGAVWINGTTYMHPGFPPGSTCTMGFSSGDGSDVLIYCYVPYQAVTAYRPTTPIDPPGDEVPNWQVIRVDLAGDIAFEAVQESDSSSEYENTPSIVDPETGSCSLGWHRRQLIRLTFDAQLGEWKASIANQDPSRLMALRITSYALSGQIPVVGFESLF